jgi:hypothetical protein
LQDHTAYKVADALAVYEPPALYDALDAELEVDHPRKE